MNKIKIFFIIFVFFGYIAPEEFSFARTVKTKKLTSAKKCSNIPSSLNEEVEGEEDIDSPHFQDIFTTEVTTKKSYLVTIIFNSSNITNQTFNITNKSTAPPLYRFQFRF